MKIIPSLNFTQENKIQEILSRLGLLREIGIKDIHIDFSDGKFTPVKTIWTPQMFFEELGKDFNFYVHLMVEDLEKNANEWIVFPNVSKIIFHLSSKYNFDFLFALKEKINLELVLAPNDNLRDFLDMAFFLSCSSLEVLTVLPGPSGQKLNFEMLEKVKIIKAEFNSTFVFVDGGVNDKNILTVKESGADGAIVATYLWESDNVVEAFRYLSQI